jgi:hypothetical protein
VVGVAIALNVLQGRGYAGTTLFTIVIAKNQKQLLAVG